jgi:hypothetical protein
LKALVTQRYKLSTLPRYIQIATVMCGFVSGSEENTMQALKNTRLYQERYGADMYAAEVEM